MTKMRGFCSECNTYRVFDVLKISEPHQMFSAIRHSPDPYYKVRCARYGYCSKGHGVIFKPMGMPLTFKFRNESINSEVQGRSFNDAVSYKLERFSIRNLNLEMHYKRGHHCDTWCPRRWSDPR